MNKSIKTTFVLLALFCLIPINCLALGENICTSEDWSIRHDMRFSGEEANFLVENLSGDPAFKITVMVYFWGNSDEYIGRSRFYQAGPIRKQFGFSRQIPKGTAKIAAEISNTWEYGQ